MLVILCSVLAVVHWAAAGETRVRWESGFFMQKARSFLGGLSAETAVRPTASRPPPDAVGAPPRR